MFFAMSGSSARRRNPLIAGALCLGGLLWLQATAAPAPASSHHLRRHHAARHPLAPRRGRIAHAGPRATAVGSYLPIKITPTGGVALHYTVRRVRGKLVRFYSTQHGQLKAQICLADKVQASDDPVVVRVVYRVNGDDQDGKVDNVLAKHIRDYTFNTGEQCKTIDVKIKGQGHLHIEAYIYGSYDGGDYDGDVAP